MVLNQSVPRLSFLCAKAKGRPKRSAHFRSVVEVGALGTNPTLTSHSPISRCPRRPYSRHRSSRSAAKKRAWSAGASCWKGRRRSLVLRQPGQGALVALVVIEASLSQPRDTGEGGDAGAQTCGAQAVPRKPLVMVCPLFTIGERKSGLYMCYAQCTSICALVSTRPSRYTSP